MGGPGGCSTRAASSAPRPLLTGAASRTPSLLGSAKVFDNRRWFGKKKAAPVAEVKPKHKKKGEAGGPTGPATYSVNVLVEGTDPVEK